MFLIEDPGKMMYSYTFFEFPEHILVSSRTVNVIFRASQESRGPGSTPHATMLLDLAGGEEW